MSVDRSLAGFLDICHVSANIILVARFVKCNSILVELLGNALSLNVDCETCIRVVGSLTLAALSPQHTREHLIVAVGLSDCHDVDRVNAHFLLLVYEIEK